MYIYINLLVKIYIQVFSVQVLNIFSKNLFYRAKIQIIVKPVQKNKFHIKKQV